MILIVGKTARCPVAARVSTFGFQSIADAGFGAKIARARRVFFDFAAQTSHVNAQIMRFGSVAAAPDFAQQMAMRQHFSGVAHQFR